VSGWCHVCGCADCPGSDHVAESLIGPCPPTAAELAALREVAGAARLWIDGAGLSDALASTLRTLEAVTGPTPPTRLALLERVAEAAQTLVDEQPGDGAVTIGQADWDRLNAALAALAEEEVRHG